MFTLADISARNDDLWTVVLVLAIIALALWILFAILSNRRL